MLVKTPSLRKREMLALSTDFNSMRNLNSNNKKQHCSKNQSLELKDNLLTVNNNINNVNQDKSSKSVTFQDTINKDNNNSDNKKTN